MITQANTRSTEVKSHNNSDGWRLLPERLCIGQTKLSKNKDKNRFMEFHWPGNIKQTQVRQTFLVLHLYPLWSLTREKIGL